MVCALFARNGENRSTITRAGEYRYQRPAKDLKDWLQRVGLTYHSPHKFRHGNAVYSLKLAKDITSLKAISQNLMHSNISITDGVYGILTDNDVRGQIEGLGQKTSSKENESIEELKIMTRQILDRLG